MNNYKLAVDKKQMKSLLTDIKELKIRDEEQELDEGTVTETKDTFKSKRIFDNNHDKIELSSVSATREKRDELLKHHQTLTAARDRETDEVQQQPSPLSGVSRHITSNPIKRGKISEQNTLTVYFEQIAKENLPKHIAIIMDGNGRWATQRGQRREEGHGAGLEAAERVMKACKKNGIEFVTLYVFSSDNWKRPPSEVSNIMYLLRDFLQRRLDESVANDIKITAIGDRSRLDPLLQEALRNAETSSAHNRYNVRLAISYGARNEIRSAACEMCKYVVSNKIDPSMIENIPFEDFIDGVPDPDLLIRTGGEKRISDFLLWQIAYTELYFTDVLWPDFSEADLIDAIIDFSSRRRRFGRSN